MNNTLFITGGAGFIGLETVTQAIKAGWQVKALVHTQNNADMLQKIGALPVVGDVNQHQTWMAEAQGAAAFIDLVQPKLPNRLSQAAIKSISAQRQEMTRNILAVLRSLPAEERPLFISVSGGDDLQPDAQGTINEHSPLRKKPGGFAYIGIPVRRLVEAAGLDATYVYFGNLVYGPGKIFADLYVKGLKNGSAHIVGKGTNRVPLVHVTDAARALVHIAGLPRADLVGCTFIAMDGADTTQRELLEYTAALMGVKKPGAVPTWLAVLVAGSIGVETIILDAHADPSALLATGFRFSYPSYRDGVLATLVALGYTPAKLPLEQSA